MGDIPQQKKGYSHREVTNILKRIRKREICSKGDQKIIFHIKEENIAKDETSKAITPLNILTYLAFITR